MQITSIKVQNYLGIKNIETNPSAKVLMVSGHNGAGKSSLADAVRHALLGEFSRVEYKKDLRSLLNDGAEAGQVVIDTTLGQYAALLPDGKVTGDHSQLNPALVYCLEPNRFFDLTTDQRRAFLFNLMGVKITPDEIARRLVENGADIQLVDVIRPHLIDGFAAGAEYAAGQARDFKVSWRTTTGETYGEKKAETWKKPIPEAPATEISEDAVKAADIEIEKLTEAIGRIKAERVSASMSADALAKHKQKIEALREHGSKYARIQHKLNKDEAELLDWEGKISGLLAVISGQGDPMPCPHCGGMVALSSHEPLLEIAKEHQHDPNAEKQLIEYEKARDLMRSAVENGKRDLAAADNAARQLSELEAQEMIDPVELSVFNQEIQQLEETLQKKRDYRDAIRHDYQKIQDALRAAEESEAINKVAAGYHGRVKDWVKIAELLEPEGIQAEMLSEAIEPFNQILVSLSEESGWPRPQIDEDMNVTFGGRPYQLRSESEQWRADAMIAAAIAIISGARMIMIDRFDVLDLHGRNELFTWLSKVDLDQVIALGTMKAPVINMPDFINFVWM